MAAAATRKSDRVQWLLVAIGSVCLVLGGAATLLASNLAPGLVKRMLTAERPVEIRLIKPGRALMDFQLTERSGRTVTAADIAGHWTVVHLLYTSCSAGCALLGQRMAEVQKLVAADPEVRLLSITVDPRTDTPAVLTKYADRLGADKDKWLFVTGPKADIYQLVETSIEPAREQKGPIIPDSFPDTDRLFIVDPQGLVRASIDGMHRGVAKALVGEMERLKKEAR